ncbi:hypothetical protein [uncultured Parvimonas sp.]|uniref:hypothetical protein n=1 Tax=uncultured Parvimonas sp. TaxID=747372 RepID=UPI00325FD70E
MKFILELESGEVAHLSKTGILEAVIKELEENNQIVKSEKEEQVTVVLPEVETVIEKIEETTKEENSSISKEEFKKRLVALSKSGKKDEVKSVLKSHGYVKVSEVKEEEFESILQELS